MKEDKIVIMKSLRNIGDICARQLVEAGVDSPEKLKKLGSEKAFLEIFKKCNQHTCINACYLYALEGAIRGIDWRAIPEKKKEQFKEFTRQLRASF